MGLRGPAPKPTAVRVMEGNLSRRPLPTNEPNYAAGIPAKPAGMSSPAKAIWDCLIAEMATSGVLRRVDGYVLAMLCEDVATVKELEDGHRKMVRDLAKKARAEKKSLPGNSAYAISRTTEGRRSAATISDLKARIIVLSREFGISPSSSSRVTATYGTPSMSPIEAALCARKLSA